MYYYFEAHITDKTNNEFISHVTSKLCFNQNGVQLFEQLLK